MSILIALCCAFPIFAVVERAVAQEKLEVVTTLNVLRWLAEEIGGERVMATSLSDPRQDPHYVQPRPTLMQKAHAADVFIEVGLQLELWAQKVVDGSGNPRIQTGQPGRIIASSGIRTLELPTVLSREWGDVHPYGNPHVWLDPVNVKKMAENIAEGLARVDPAHQEEYRSRLESLSMRLDDALFGADLVKEVGSRKLTRLAERDQLFDYLTSSKLEGKLGGWLKQALPLRGRSLVSYHKTWAYLVRCFGLTVPVEIEEKPGISPSARHRDHVIEIMQQQKIPVILMAGFYERTAADFIAGKTGARVLTVSIDVGGDEGSESYFDFMDRLIAILVDAVRS
jgi:zinc/manganese transport system substrate-binding protein